jgi:CelD/BcsL family acetyltransferase involved in cellulose biosynthesis
MNITISRGSTAAQLLENPAFCAKWAALCDRCAWSTSYQSPAFLRVWYRVYSARFEPVIVTAQSDNSALCGILCLAVSLETGGLVSEGEVQSEYQCWVSDAEHGNEFGREAVLAVRREFPHEVLKFRYLPPSIPLNWLADPRLRSRTVLTKKRRPLLRFAQMESDSLSKTNNRKRLKGLKKLGEMEFRRLTSAQELEAAFHDFAVFCDLRLGAMHGQEPFKEDPLKKTFQLELMNEHGLLHVTVLKVGDVLASAHINVCDGKQLHLNLIGYNPMLARHSPGKFHIHMLSQMLITEGYAELDLTPGGDPYKERFANSHDTAYVLSFHPTAMSRAKTFVGSRGELWARRTLDAMQLHPARARDTLESLRPPYIRDTLRPVLDRISSQHETRIYVREISPSPDPLPQGDVFRRDALEDLLAYCPVPRGLSRKRFLSDAMDRLEEGQHLYSCVRDNRLLYVGWVIERPSESFVSHVLPDFQLPTGDALIMRLCAYGRAEESPLAAACLETMLVDLASVKAIKRATIGIAPGHNQIPLLEAAGFFWETSLFAATRFGKVRRWSQQVDSIRAPEAEMIESPVDR